MNILEWYRKSWTEYKKGDLTDWGMLNLAAVMGERIGSLLAVFDFQPRAAKLMVKQKPFIVVANDETYYLHVYEIIRTSQMLQGTWTSKDEDKYLGAVGVKVDPINQSIRSKSYYQVQCTTHVCSFCRDIGITYFANSFADAVAEFKDNGWLYETDHWICPECRIHNQNDSEEGWGKL